MSEQLSTSVRVLGLFFELLTSERGRTKSRIRRLPGYAGLGDAAFESQFQRDKDALRESGVVLTTSGSNGDVYRVSGSSFASPHAPLDETDLALIHLAIGAWNGKDVQRGAVEPKVAAATDAPTEDSRAALSLNLSGAQTIADLAAGIRERRIVSFLYASAHGRFERAVAPWRLIVRGRALYLWGEDLDRGEERLFRISRFQSPVSFLGEAGDAGPVPEGLADPFVDMLVSPLLAVHEDAEGRVRARGEVLDSPAPSRLGDGWSLMRGDEAETGEWITTVLTDPERIVVLEPASLREAVINRLRAAAHREDTHA